MKYLVIYEKLATGWSAYSPDLPGLGATGEMLDDVKELIHETMELHLSGVGRQVDRIAKPSTAIEYTKIDSHA
jgi:predicted RNase H-like HicB family nuclease